MKRLAITCVFVLIVSAIFSQETKQITLKFNNSDLDSVSYNVLVSNDTVKHGEYVLYCYYDTNVYPYISYGVSEKGKYSLGKRVGVWSIFKENTQVEIKYDYDSIKTISTFIKVELFYPAIAKEEGIQGTVKLKYHLNSDGSIGNILVLKSVSPECDEEAIRQLKKIGEFSKKYPVDNQKEADIEVHVNFKLRL